MMVLDRATIPELAALGLAAGARGVKGVWYCSTVAIFCFTCLGRLQVCGFQTSKLKCRFSYS